MTCDGISSKERYPKRQAGESETQLWMVEKESCLRGGGCRQPPRRGEMDWWTEFRGLKPTSTFMQSLRDEECSARAVSEIREEVHLLRIGIGALSWVPRRMACVDG
jgi:hypothetical protein